MEDYDAASQAQERLTALRAADPLRSLRRQRAAAVAAEQYDEAATVQAALKRLRLARPRLLWRDEIAALSRGGKSLLAIRWDDKGKPRVRTLLAPRDGYSFTQISWAPDGEALAVAEVPLTYSDRDARVLLLPTDGSRAARSFAVPEPVFFMYWTPDAEALTFLHADRASASSGGPPLVLGAIDAASGATTLMRRGGPLFYVLGPLGELVAFDGFSKVVDWVRRKGAAEGAAAGTEAEASNVTLSTRPGAFRTPMLAGAAHAILCEGGEVVAVERSSGRRAALLTVSERSADAGAALVLSPDGARLAVLHAAESARDDESAAEEADEAAEEVDEAGELGEAGSRLRVLRAASGAQLVAGGEGVAVSELPCAQHACVAMWWSPDSSALLCLDVPEGADEGDSPRCCFEVFRFDNRGGETDGDAPPPQPLRSVYEAFVPSEMFLQAHVPFYDQHAVAGQTPWGADSLSFSFVDAAGTLFVQRLDDPPERVGGVPVAASAARVSVGVEVDVAWPSPC